jgi:lipoprotein NlpI
MGLCLAQLGQKAAALAALDRALEIDPTYTPAHSNRKVVETMTEGSPLENATFKSINHGLDEHLKKRG